MKRVLVLGNNGQLAKALAACVPAGVHCECWGKNEVDLSDPGNKLSNRLRQWQPDAVINASAYTAVDRAEQETDACWRLNRDAVAEIAVACREIGIRLAHVSTDFVFDGASSRPYQTTDTCNPLNIYGQSKRAGEQVLMREYPDAIIVRTAWLYSLEGHNFLMTMLRLMSEKPALRVVSDQIGTPTRALNLAAALWKSLQKALPGGIWHYTDAGVASWYDFAVAIQELAVELQLLDRRIPIQPIFTEDYPTPARRAHFSVLDCRETWQTLGLEPPHWRQALADTLYKTAQVRS